MAAKIALCPVTPDYETRKAIEIDMRYYPHNINLWH
jgi:hypothetical protein